MLSIRVVTETGKRLRLIVPDGPFVMKLILKNVLEEQESLFNKEKFAAFMKVYRQVKKHHRHLVLVDVKSHDGSSVFIKL